MHFFSIIVLVTATIAYYTLAFSHITGWQWLVFGIACIAVIIAELTAPA